MAEIALLLEALDQAYDRRAWHGTNLRGSLRGVTAEEAAWRPAPGRHNVWELALHAAYWKYVACYRILGGKRGSFACPGSNFFVRPEGAPTEKAWKADLALLSQYHGQLRAAVAALDPSRLDEKAKTWNVRQTILGVAMHDTYHAGQIQLLKRLREEGSEGSMGQGRLSKLAAELAQDPRPFSELGQEEKLGRLRRIQGVGVGLLTPSEEFARQKAEEVEIEDRKLGR
jgi:hypothetical protein